MPAPQNRDLMNPGLPTVEQLLLRAVIGDADKAQASLAAWKQASGYRRYDEIEFSTTLLLPRIYRRLVQAGHSDPWFPQLAGLTRYQWLHNLEELRHFLPVLTKLQTVGVHPLLTGGWALLAGGYLDDIQDHPQLAPQLLIQPAEGLATRQALQALDWYSARLPPVAGWQHEYWQGADEGRLRISYQWLPRRYPVVGFESLIPHATRGNLSGQEAFIPSATDLVEQLCVQACQERPTAGHRIVYLVDALRILQHAANRLDWERLLFQSQARATFNAVRQSLCYLAEEFAAPIPAEWLLQFSQLEPAYSSWLATNGPWRRYLRAEQAAGRSPSGLRAARYAWWQIASRIRLAKAS